MELAETCKIVSILDYAAVEDLALVALVAFLTWSGNSQTTRWKFKV